MALCSPVNPGTLSGGLFPQYFSAKRVTDKTHEKWILFIGIQQFWIENNFNVNVKFRIIFTQCKKNGTCNMFYVQDVHISRYVNIIYVFDLWNIYNWIKHDYLQVVQT